MEKRFRILRIVATLYKILAWVVLVTGILSAVGTLIAGIAGGALIPQQYSRALPAVSGMLWGIMGFLVALLLSALYFVGLYALGEVLCLFLAIEENTRETTLWLRRQGGAQAAATVIAPRPPA